MVAVKNIAEDAKTASNAWTKILSEQLRDLVRIIPKKYANETEFLAAMKKTREELDSK